MEIEERSAKKVDYNGQTYFVASDDCKRRFLADPAKYTGMSEHAGISMDTNMAAVDVTRGGRMRSSDLFSACTFDRLVRFLSEKNELTVDLEESH